MPSASEASSLVSVVIPCRNEARHIETTVDAILNSDYPNVEIIVVDGMSEDGTREVLNQLSARDARVRQVDNPKRLTPIARNIGIKAARGAYILVCDSRNVIEPHYISTMLEALLSSDDVACVGGNYQHIYDSTVGRYISLAMTSKFGVGVGNYRTMTENTFVDTVGVPLYRREIFDHVGFFDEDLTRNQDDEFNFRVRQRGLKVMYVHGAAVTYLVRPSYKKAFQQFRQYGYFKVLVNCKHGTLTTLRQVIPAVFVATVTISFLLGLVFPYIRSFLSLIILLYLISGLVLAGPRLSIFDRLQVVGACFVLHWGYGIGYLEGLWHFVICRKSTANASLQKQTI